MSEWTGQDWAIFFGALSAFLATFGGAVTGIYEKLRKIHRGVEETKSLANGNLSVANSRIEQLTKIMSENGLSVPETVTEIPTPETGKEGVQ